MLDFTVLECFHLEALISPFPLFSPQCKVDKLVFIDVADSSTRGGSTDLEIFSLPNVEVFRGMLSSTLSRCPCTNAPELTHP